MKFELKSNEKSVVKFATTIENAQFREAVSKAFKKDQKKFNLPGFRKGKAPRRMIEAQYGEEIFYEEAVNILIPDAYETGLEELSLEPIARPELEVLKIGKDDELVIEFEVVIMPKAKLGAYKGLEVEKIDTIVTDEEVMTELETLREQNARLVSVEDRVIEDGDTLTINYVGTVDGVEFDGGSAEAQELIIGSNTFIPGFEAQLIGANIDDDVEVNVTFPAEYQSAELAGKDAMFKVQIIGNKVKELPELDDDFALDTSEFDTIDEYKAHLKEKMQNSSNESAERALRDNVIAKAVENMEVDIPEVMVEKEIDGMLREFEMQLSQQGYSIEQYAQLTGGSTDSLRESVKKDATIRVETGLLFDAIKDAEKIEATDEEVEAEYAKYAEAQNSTIEEIKTLLGNNVAYIKDSIESRKTVDFLVDNADVK